MAWAYDSPKLRTLLHKGLVHLDVDDMEKTYNDWVNEDIILTFIDYNTEETKEFISPKRGNASYARKKSLMVWEIKKGLDKLNLDCPVQGMRSSLYRDTHLFLITLTFDQKRISAQDAWEKLTSKGGALNRFSANLSKVFGTKAKWTIKEGTSSDYPAPHILLFVDRPVHAFLHNRKWRLKSEATLERLRKAWPYGFIDVEAVVSNKVGKRNVVHYLTKYLTKTVVIGSSKKASMSSGELKAQRIAIKTHIWNKVFRCRDVLSKAFKERLNTLRRSIKILEGPVRKWSLLSAEHTVSSLNLELSAKWGRSPQECGRRKCPEPASSGREKLSKMINN